MKIVKYLIIIVFSFFLVIPDCFCLVNTKERTVDKPLVPEDITVGENNIDDILKTPSINSKDKLYDFCGILNKEEEKEIKKLLNTYYKYSNMENIIVITDDLLGFDIANYSYNFYDYNDFLDDGVIFILHIYGDKYEIFMSNSGKKNGKAFKIYTDSRIKSTLKYVYNKMNNNNYYEGLVDYIKITSEFYNRGVNNNSVISEDGKVIDRIPLIEIIILSVTSSLIVVLLLLGKLNSKKFIKYDMYDDSINRDTYMIKTVSDEVIDDK